MWVHEIPYPTGRSGKVRKAVGRVEKLHLSLWGPSWVSTEPGLQERLVRTQNHMD